VTYVDPLDEIVLSSVQVPDRNRLTQIDGQACYSDFVGEFLFHKDGNYWESRFIIHVSKDGTPVLRSVEVLGFRELYKWEIELIEPTGTAIPVTSPGVQRWQLNIITEHRHELLKQALVTSINSVNGSGSGYLTGKELKALERKVSKKLSQRVVTNDLLRNVANVYSESLNNGLTDPIIEVMALTDRSHRRSQEYVQMARDKNYLPATDPGVATGKAKPKRRQVNNGKTKHR
jgi:hypothetical protein